MSDELPSTRRLCSSWSEQMSSTSMIQQPCSTARTLLLLNLVEQLGLGVNP